LYVLSARYRTGYPGRYADSNEYDARSG
jgi:hypothetical protein